MNPLQQALAAFQNGKLVEAKSLLDQLLASNPKPGFDLLRLSGAVNVQMGDLNGGIVHLRNALALARGLQQTLGAAGNLATAMLMSGDDKGALGLLQRVLEMEPGQASAYMRSLYCSLLSKLSRWDDLKTFARPLQAWNGFEVEGINYGLESAISLQDRLEVDRLAKVLVETSLIFPHKQIAPLISMLISLQKIDVAEICLDRYEKASPQAIVRAICMSLIANAKKDSALVAKLIDEEVIEKARQDQLFDVLQLYKIRAQSLDRLGDYDDAYEDYSSMANLQIQRYSGAQFIDVIPQYQALDLVNLNSAIEKRPRDPEHQQLTPIFMIGFPRSGTTLLENILGTQKSLTELSEIGTLEYVSNEMFREFGVELPKDLLDLSESQLARARSLYFERVAQAYPEYDRTSQLVDKMPAYTIAIPLILRLFPNAKFIFSLRHPLDCCLSSFQQLFKMDQEMSFLVSMESSIKRYADIMNLYESYESVLDLNVHYVKYEDLVQNIDAEVIKLAEFLELSFDESYRDFAAYSKNKVVATPSASQVAQGMYLNSKEKWRNYDRHVRPFAPKVEKYIKKWGYTI